MRTRERERVRVERTIGQAEGAVLTVGQLCFDLSEGELQQLAAAVLRCLQAGAAAAGERGREEQAR